MSQYRLIIQQHSHCYLNVMFLEPGLAISDFYCSGLSEHDRLCSFEMLGQNSRKDLNLSSISLLELIQDYEFCS